MMILLEHGGIAPGGLNFDAKIRRNSTDLEDLFHAHIGGMDTFARGLLIADEILTNSDYIELRDGRYRSFNSGDGEKFAKGNLTLGELRALAIANGEPELRSGKQELIENLVNRYIR